MVVLDALGITVEYLLIGTVDYGLIFGMAMGTLALGAFAIVVQLLIAARRQNEITARARAQAAVLAERQRLAREMHDLLAHTLSAQVVHLEGARLLLEHDRFEQAKTQVARAVRLARDGLSETKRALEALRGDDVRLADRLGELASDFHGNCEVHVVEPEGLTVEAQWAILRTAQEALTNVRKHASGARISVILRRKGASYELEVADTGGQPGELSDAGGGYGLTGMRERAELLGGSLDAGPNGAGFRVRLTVPA
ncbi:sensor histidine kinase [Fodinicola acaciae]|uniref:sensor histidine kinase n=1 Tax=Fodinicola acaciae TaxID=2681555 RepID=UPI0013D305CE|nr:histidine kinase [Fodinicola acaciae]